MKLGTTDPLFGGINMRLLSVFLLMFSVKAFAQDYQTAEKLDQFQHIKGTYSATLKDNNPVFDPFIEKMSKQLATQLEEKYKVILADLSLPVKDCSLSDQTLRKVRAFQNSADLDACVKLAETCAQATDEAAQLVLLTGASCAYQKVDIKKSKEIFEVATAPVFENSKYQDIAVYKYALFAGNTQYDQQVPEILARYKKWNAQEVKDIRAVMDMVNNGHVDGYTDADILQKVQSLILKNADWANELTMAWASHLAVNRYDRVGALHFLENTFQNIFEVDKAYKYVFISLYHTPGENYKLSEPSLEVYYKHSGPYSWYPIEQNTHLVTDIFTNVCPKTLTHDQLTKDLEALKKVWLEGGDHAQVLQDVEALNKANPDKADIVTFYASVLSSMGQENLAFENYWKAHQLCNYYHRATWGLSSIKKDRLYRSFDDYAGIRARVKATVAQGIYPASISNYVMNWSMLNDAQKEGVKYAIRIWAPYSDGLVAAHTNLYIKSDFQYHSEIPGYEFDRDDRVWPPDNRSADEIRGRGGNPVVADLGELMRTPHGDYNLAAHEMAHSFHLNYLPFVQRGDLEQCITALYQDSQKRGVFADPYAASHENEYFAQSVGYYLIPDDAPRRFGLTGAWVKKYDPNMYEFVKRIDEAKGDISKVHCPIGASLLRAVHRVK
jgi:hypothetical protein